MSAFAVATWLIFGAGGVGATATNPPADQGFGFLVGDTSVDSDGQPIWLPDHYDNSTSNFTGAPTFDDSAKVIFTGDISGFGKATVEQSAAWTFTTYAAFGGPGATGPTGPCAVVYDTSRTLVKIHTHQGVTTDPRDGLGGGAGADISGLLSLNAAQVTALGSQPFGATVTITHKNGGTIIGSILGGSNCEVKLITSATHGIYTSPHTDTFNTVQTVFKITGGTHKKVSRFDSGVPAFTYDTGEPHGLHGASITLFP